MNEIDVAWCAGFYEGEGTIACSLQERKHVPDYPNLVLQIPQNYIEPLERFRDTFGVGAIDEKRGGVEFVYRIGGLEQCERIIDALRPHLSPRRIAQADEKLDMARKQIQARIEYDKTCRAGHSLEDKDNVYTNTRGVKECRTCRRQYSRDYRKRKNERLRTPS